MLFLSLGCSENTSFKSNCMSAAKIIKEANSRLINANAENVVENGKIVSTIIHLDNSKSKEYLLLKDEALRKHYDIIKAFYHPNSTESFDALCVLAVLNEYIYSLNGIAIDEHCKYTKLLTDHKSGELPSSWLLNEFFNYINTPPGFHDDNWARMNNKEKYEFLIQGLLIPDEFGNNCLNEKT